MEEKQIPYFIHEGMVARMERMNQRLWITSIILILALIASNLAWFFYDQQFETYEEQTTVTQSEESGEGDAGQGNRLQIRNKIIQTRRPMNRKENSSAGLL